MAKNDNEAEALVRFRHAILSLQKDDLNEYLDTEKHFLLRWLRARNLDVDKAKTMLQKYLEWRISNSDLKLISNGNWSPPKMITDRVKVKITGHDFEGRPIIWADAGRRELGQIHDTGLGDELFHYTYSLMNNYILPEVERLRKQKNVSQFIFVLDTIGVTLRKARKLGFDLYENSKLIFQKFYILATF